jgi:hypothetical protein
VSLFVFFGIASFFNGGLLGEPPLRFSGLPLFSSEVFWVSPFAFFGVTSFFIRALLGESMNEGSDSVPLFMALILCVKRFSSVQLTLLVVSTLL